MPLSVNNNTVSVKDESLFEIEDLETNTGLLMLQVSNLWKDYHDKVLKKYHGLSHIQYAVLAGIYSLNNKKQVTQTLIVQHTRIDPMTISQIFKQLESKDYISQTNHPADDREKVVHLTQKGKDLVSQVLGAIVETDGKFFKSLGENAGHFNNYLKTLLEMND